MIFATFGFEALKFIKSLPKNFEISGPRFFGFSDLTEKSRSGEVYLK